MLEAVNSVLSNASATRVSAEQVSTVRSYAANPEKIQETARPSKTTTITIDNTINRAILEVRDNSSGDIVRQFPTEGQLKAYRLAQQLDTSKESREAPPPQAPSITVESSSSQSTTQTASVAPQPSAAPQAPAPTSAPVQTTVTEA